MNLLQRLRPGFLARSRREKILFAAFVVAFVGIWGFTLTGRIGAALTAYRAASANAGEQQQWLEHRTEIEARYEQAIARLSAATLPTRNDVLAQVQALAGSHGITPRIDAAATQHREQLTIHPINVLIDGAEYGALSAFQREIAAALPTVNLRQIKITADRRNPRHLNARLSLEAIEFNR